MTLTAYPTHFKPLQITPEGILCEAKLHEVKNSYLHYGGWSGGTVLMPFSKFAYMLTEEQKQKLRYAKKHFSETDYTSLRQKVFSECLACEISPLLVSPATEGMK